MVCEIRFSLLAVFVPIEWHPQPLCCKALAGQALGVDIDVVAAGPRVHPRGRTRAGRIAWIGAGRTLGHGRLAALDTRRFLSSIRVGRASARAVGNEASEVPSVRRIRGFGSQTLDLVRGDVTGVIGNLFWTSYLEPLPLFDRLDKCRRF